MTPKLTMPFEESFFEELKRCRLQEARLTMIKKTDQSGLCSFRAILSARFTYRDTDYTGIIIRAERQVYFGPIGAENEGDPFFKSYKKAADSVYKWVDEMKKKYGVEVLPGEWVE